MDDKKISVKFIEYKRITNIKDYYTVSHDRWKNAINCYNNGDYFASLYLAGYSVECLLKYVVLESKFKGEDTKPNGLHLVNEANNKGINYKILTNPNHDIAKLITLGNEENIFVAPKQSDFKNILEWKSEWRYATNHNINNKDIAKDFLTEVIDLSQQLKDNLNNCKIDKFVFFKKDGE